MAGGEVALLGVRHHGPGSARAVRAALEQFKPDTVLVEGPPEADGVVALAAHRSMRPPVALLAHAVDDSGKAGFWPFAEFSPEWVAIRYALADGIPVRFIDLPAAHTFAMAGKEDEPAREESGPDGDRPDRAGRQDPGDASGAEEPGRSAHGDPPGRAPEAEAGAEGEAPPPGPAEEVSIDPLGVLAEAAGYDDAERWWEDAVEHRVAQHGGDALAPFAALADAMGALREEYGHGGHRDDPLREAHMRLRIREAQRSFDRIAVVCGAWHVPALAEPTTATADRRLLKGLPRTKVEATWVPWTHRRLGQQSGYGAGIASPGWYHHLFTTADRPARPADPSSRAAPPGAPPSGAGPAGSQVLVRWMTKVAGLLREEDQPVSSAHVIESVRLAETLAAVRGRPLAGLSEATDAVRAVMCEGSDIPLALVHDRLVVGDELGEVPDRAPAVPLQRDLARTQRALRLKPEALVRDLQLDLRKETDAARSLLLHRLELLGVHWGTQQPDANATGTFREAWRLQWEPELAVRVAEAGVWGTTVVAAATAKAEDTAVKAASLADVTQLAEECLLAELPGALPTVMRVLADRAALDADVGHLALALPALVRSVRYGDVRGTDSAALREVARGLAVRVCVGLPPACTGLDADGAREMCGHLDAAHQSIGLLGDRALADQWAGALTGLAEREAGQDGASGISGLLRGRAARLLLDDGRMETGEAARLMGLAFSPGTPPSQAAAWIEGFLAGGGMLLVHDERLLGLVDQWLTGVPADAFDDVLPLLRRTFSQFESGVRRTVGELVRRGATGSPAVPGTARAGGDGFGAEPDTARADAALPVLRLLLGLDPDPGPGPDQKAPAPGTEPADPAPGSQTPNRSARPVRDRALPTRGATA